MRPAPTCLSVRHTTHLTQLALCLLLLAVVSIPLPLFSSFNISTSGQEQYLTYCSGCHGLDGRGRGRVSAYCKVPPTDLSQLAVRNKGIYPAERVCEVLRHGTGHPSNGQGYMPTWEPLLKSMNADPPGLTELRIQNLAAFVKTLQDSPPPHQK